MTGGTRPSGPDTHSNISIDIILLHPPLLPPWYTEYSACIDTRWSPGRVRLPANIRIESETDVVNMVDCNVQTWAGPSVVVMVVVVVVIIY